MTANEARIAFYSGLKRGGVSKRRLRRLAKVAFKDEPVRLRSWLQSLRRGHKIIFKTHEVEFVAGQDLDTLDEARRVLQDDDALRQEVEDMR